MSVRLIASTVPAISEAGVTGGDLVAFAARVSNPANQSNRETAPKLLRYLREHKHWSPFEMAHAVLEIVTTRDIARQILRHRSFAFQEFSQRYSSEIEFTEPRQVRLQDTKNRQNSIEEGVPDHVVSDWSLKQQAVARLASETYTWAIGHGVAKEVARAVLPEGLTISRLYMAGSLRSWLHYLEVRLDPATQKEHREVALACQTVLAGAFPEVFGDG